jgi:acetyl-CoA decarbonylase/synthase complex subunit delta
MKVEWPTEKRAGKINELTIGKTSAQGGTRTTSYTIGGGTSMPFIKAENGTPNRPRIAMEVHSAKPEFQGAGAEELAGVMDDPVAWARTCVDEWGADLICLKFTGANPDGDDCSVDECASLADDIMGVVGVPVMFYGCGDESKDALIMSTIGDTIKKEGAVIGMAENDKFKSMAASAIAYNAHLVAFSNLDINLAKQLNILLFEYGMPAERIIMDPLQGALGYGVEYSYSVIERIRLAALAGDKTIQAPMLCDVSIANNYREAYEPTEGWGDANTRSILWEGVTAMSALTAGADLLIVRCPSTVKVLNRMIDRLMGGGD